MADEGINYFPLYCTLDEKWELIEAEFGLRGFAILIKLFQRIYREHGYYCEWSDDISLLLAAAWNVSTASYSGDVRSPKNIKHLPAAAQSSSGGRAYNLIDKIVDASVRRGIFDRNLFEKYAILTSHGIQKNFVKIVRNRKQIEIKKDYLLLSVAEIEGKNVRIEQSDVRIEQSDVRMEQRKGKERKGNNNPPISPFTRFEDFLSAYPKQVRNRYLAETAYCRLLHGDPNLTESDLIVAAENYAEAVSILGTEERYVKEPQNFMKDRFWVQYLDGEYRKPTPGKSKKEHGFQQRDYDFEKLEKELLRNERT